MRTAIPRSIFFSLLLIAGIYTLNSADANAEASKTPDYISSKPTDSLGIALGDMDGDGDLDVALANKSVPSQIFRNDGAGNFTLAWEQSQFVAAANDAKWGDLDGDGDLDLVLAYQGAASQVFRNDTNQNISGAATFVPAWQSPTGSVNSRGLAIGDLNGDGRLDLVFVTDTSGTQIFANSGNLVFTLRAQPQISAEDVDLADFDNNGSLDLALAAPNVPVLRNIGNFNFQPVQIDGQVSHQPVGIRWGDAENDGDLDLALVIGGDWNAIYLYINNSGGFSQVIVRDLVGQDRLSGLAWEDYDNDGDYDILVSSILQIGERYFGCGCIEVLANDGRGNLALAWDSRPDRPGYSAVVLGDLDQDGDLDIVGSTNTGYPVVPSRSRYYRQDVGFPMIAVRLTASAGSSQNYDWPRELVVADLDGDRDLDIVTSFGFFYYLFRNDGDLSFVVVGTYNTPASPSNNIHAIAAGDIDRDGDLDLAFGFAGSSIQVLRNDGNFTFVKVWEAADQASTYGLAWADIDGDGLLDLVAANHDAKSVIYRNLGSASFSLLWEEPSSAPTVALSVNDVDGDGDSDIAFARDGQPVTVWRNLGAGQLELLWSASTDLDNIVDLLLGDMDNDGLSDLLLRDTDGRVAIYRNSVGTRFIPQLDLPVDDKLAALALGDVDVDGDLDLAAVGNGPTSSVWLLENHGKFELSIAWRSQPKIYCDFCSGYDYVSTAWADMDGDGSLDLIVAGDTTRNGGEPETTLYQTASSKSRSALTAQPMISVHPPSSAGTVSGGTGTILESRVISVPFSIATNSTAPLAWIDATYSADNGSSWLPAAPVPNAWRPGGTNYLWNVIANNFFGQSDYVLFRIRALAQSPIPYATATFLYTNTVAGPFQYAPRISTSTPFRVRGTQVRVLNNDQPQSDVIVYRIQAADDRKGQVMGGDSGPYRTNSAGYLGGRGQIGADDRLIALLPLSYTATYAAYNTSSVDPMSGLPSYTVTQAGVQTLTVSADNPLILFNLDVALEWDASKDTIYLTQLQYDLNRTSELLYNWTNGQAALGRIRIFHDARRQPAGQDGFQPWLDSHIRIYATNRMHPNAIQGGITPDRTVETTPNGKTISYTPGMVHIGAVWDRYAESSALGEDWPRALAHELGHYLFFLDDNYIGQANDGSMQFISADPSAGCPGVMNDPYTDFLAKFQPKQSWLPGCANTYSHQLLGRADWDTIAAHYPWLRPPTTPIAQVNPGPSGLRLAFTQFEFVPPPDAPADQQTLGVPIFTIATADGSAYRPSPEARAFLLQGGRLIDLGAPALDQLYARGVRNGDTLYLLEPDSGRAGYVTAAPSVDRLVVKPVTDWKPQVIVTPINSRYLAIAVKGVNAGRSLRAQLYPRDGDATESIELAPTADGYAGTFQLATEIFEGNLRIWDANDPFRQVLTDFVFGSNPERWDARDARWRARLARWRARFVPVIAAGGRVAVLGDNVAFGAEDWLFSLQTATALPNLPAWATPVGPGYWLHATANAPDLSGTAISFNYDRRDVPSGLDTSLRVFFWNGAVWTLLPTNVDPEQGLASAHTQGPGLYALVAAPEISLQGPGWNIFSYSLVGSSTPVANALSSIDGLYSIVYAYEPSNIADPWHVFDATAPDWANDLKTLEYGKSYLIYAKESATLHPSTTDALPSPSAVPTNSQTGLIPPAVFYGVVQGTDDFVPEPNQTVIAWIDDKSCGQTLTEAIDNTVVYAVDVASSISAAGCGDAGRTVRFTVADIEMISQATWDNVHATNAPLTLQNAAGIYMPYVQR